MKSLLRAGADPNLHGCRQSALGHVLANNYPIIFVRKLLAAGADPNVCPSDGFTPLHVALGGTLVPEKIRMLVEAGANIDPQIVMVGAQGYTPLHMALSRGEDTEVIASLLDHGASLDIKEKEEGRNALEIAVYEARTMKWPVHKANFELIKSKEEALRGEEQELQRALSEKKQQKKEKEPRRRRRHRRRRG